MPRVEDPAVLAAKLSGYKSCNLIKLDQGVPSYLTDNAYNVEHNGDTYMANGLLLEVEPGAMTNGSKTNDWEFKISAVDNAVYSALLGQQFKNRWVYHYEVFFIEDETGVTLVGVEERKFGIIHNAVDEDDEGENNTIITFTVTSPYGDTQQRNALYTNSTSQYIAFGNDDHFFQFSHETDYKIKRTTTGTGGGFKGGPGGQRGDDGEYIDGDLI